MKNILRKRIWSLGTIEPSQCAGKFVAVRPCVEHICRGPASPYATTQGWAAQMSELFMPLTGITNRRTPCNQYQSHRKKS